MSFSSPVVRAVVIVAAVATVSACGRREEKAPGAHPVAPPNIGERAKVLNADVLVIDGQHLRLAGFYAPQGVPDARCWAEALAAKQATDALRRMIAAGHSIRFDAVGGKDEYDRQYAKVTLNGVDLGQTLYDEGLVARVPGKFGWCGPISRNEAGAPDVRAVMDVGG